MRKISQVFLFVMLIFLIAFSISSQSRDNRSRISSSAKSSDLVLLYKCMATSPASQSIRAYFNIRNQGAQSIALTDLAIRYYFTLEKSVGQQFHCDWAVCGTNFVKGRFEQVFENDYYLEVSFSGGPAIKPGQESGAIQLRWHNTDWSQYNQSNDYSFNPDFTDYGEWVKVELYQSGVKVWPSDGSVNNPPQVNITEPLNNSQFNMGDHITIRATASDSDGSVSKVEFFAGSTKIGQDTTSPYQMVWENVSAGNYKLIAKATDDGNKTGVSSVNIRVDNPGQTIYKPFPQNLSYPGCIKPNHVSQSSLNSTLTAYYEDWKQSFLKQSNGTTPGGGYYINMKGTGGTGNEITTSEAHGWGMLIFALMAGHDSRAREYFDGMYNMYDKHRSTIDNDLMSWIIDKSELTQYDSDSATDGDLDIAYALLLAHNQWGSSGAINYLDQARRIITNGIKESEMGSHTFRTKLGDWDSNQYSTRSSDWMTDHFEVYFNATNDQFWNNAIAEAYDMIDVIGRNYSAQTGLMPDFVIDDPPKPAPPNFLEAETDDDFSWNACRFPLRIAVDYAHNNRLEAKNSLDKIISWIKTKTNNNPNNIKAGYKLNGDPLVTYSSAAFSAPMVAACIVNAANQQYLNQGWDAVKSMKYDYYGDTINLLSMLVITGNWWKPEL